MKGPDWCFRLFMENVGAAFLIQYLTPPQTVNILPFVTKCFEPETSMFLTTLTSPVGFTFSQSGVSSCTPPLPLTASADPKLPPVSEE